MGSAGSGAHPLRTLPPCERADAAPSRAGTSHAGRGSTATNGWRTACASLLHPLEDLRHLVIAKLPLDLLDQLFLLVRVPGSQEARLQDVELRAVINHGPMR